MKVAYKKIIEKAKSQKKQTKKYLITLKKKNIKNIDKVFKETHLQVFNKIDCLECANCCKKLGPLFNKTDIQRISNFLSLKNEDFIKQYLTLDEDNDYVFKTMPCPFLLDNNCCQIYAVRPKACREYPHSDQKNMQKRLNLAIKNSIYCPALYEIIEKVKIILN